MIDDLNFPQEEMVKSSLLVLFNHQLCTLYILALFLILYFLKVLRMRFIFIKITFFAKRELSEG